MLLNNQLLNDTLKNMSINYLQGLFFLKLQDFIKIDDLEQLFFQDNLQNFDAFFRELINKKFSSLNEKNDFLKKDIQFHQSAIRNEKEFQTIRFLQGITMPIDYYNISLLLEKVDIKNITEGYFKKEELQEIVQGKFSHIIIVEETIKFLNQYKNLKSKKDKNRFIAKSIKKYQPKVLEATKFNLINKYFQIIDYLEKDKENLLKTLLPLKIFKFIPQNKNHEKELFLFYLPYLISGGSVNFLTNPFEFIFYYLTQRFTIWKIINQYIL